MVSESALHYHQDPLCHCHHFLSVAHLLRSLSPARPQPPSQHQDYAQDLRNTQQTLHEGKNEVLSTQVPLTRGFPAN